MNMSENNFPYKKIVVTGGAGFLGRVLVQRLRDFAGTEVFVPRSKDYNLVEGADVIRLLEETQPLGIILQICRMRWNIRWRAIFP